MPIGAVHAGPIRVLLLSADEGTERLVEEVLHASGSHVHLVTHATWDRASAEALLGDPDCCVLLELDPDTPRDDREDALTLLEYVRMSAPEAPIVVLCASHDEPLALSALERGAQDCLVTAELEPGRLRRALIHAVERKRVEARLVRQALHDQLTGLPNRALFLDRLGVALERSRRSGAPLAVLFLDFDNFKQINDSRGHTAGDRLLATLAARLGTLLRPMDTVARFGGDEFAFLFEGVSTEREAVLIADRICHAARLPVDLGGVAVSVTVSIGIAIVRDPTVAPEAIIREADAAMYWAKERGRARYELFDEDSRQRARDRIEFEAAIRQAVERCELRVHYQPSLLLHGPREVAGVEALVRWQHPRHGLTAAQGFMPLANDIGLVIPIGRFVLQHGLAQLVRWRARKPDMTLSLNVSSAELRDPALPRAVGKALEACGLEPAALCLEAPERALSEDPGSVITAFEHLKAVGVRIAIDDFGAGALPLAKLRGWPIDALKLHSSFVADLDSSPRAASLLAALLDLGHALGLQVVAKGVETQAQLAQLRVLRCDAVQGYALMAPVTADQVHDMLLAAVA
ncbi:MAG: EAL domain-containing protein [Solirubrobacterales bacterium]|nr:EAL domain-containing protein [Solirubrobacterales bacterium]